ncbi:MAG: hypothetical protein ACOYL6_04510 [Bacteriovoracaceae bacterium]
MKILEINQTHHLFKEFIGLPYKLYPGKMDWVPPFKESVYLELSPSNTFFQHGECTLFVAIVNDSVVGRISASIDSALTANEKTGHIGYFECIEDKDIGLALIAKAEEWHRSKETKIIHGPLNLNIYTGYRFMTDSFEKAAYLGEPRTLPYYPSIFIEANYKPITSWRTFELSARHHEQIISEMAPKVAQFKDPKADYKIIPLRFDTFENELKELYPLCLSIFQENYGYADMSLDEFLSHYAPLKALYLEHYFLKVVDGAGTPIAFSYVYPNRIEDFKKAQGSYTGYHPTEFKSSTVLSVFGVSKAYRRSTIAYELVLYTFDKLKANNSQLSFASLTKEGKTFMDHLDCPVRTYAMYEKRL